MTSTLITSGDLKDLDAAELKSKFFELSRDIQRMRKVCEKLPHAEASLANVSRAMAERSIRPPKP